MRAIPSACAARRMSRLPSIVPAPSSIPGRTCEWRSISGLRRLDVHDLELELAARCGDLHRLALLAAHDRLADRRLIRQLVLGGVRFGGADDVVLDGLVRLHVAEPDFGAHPHFAG